MSKKLYLLPLSKSNKEGVRCNIWLSVMVMEDNVETHFIDNNVKRYKLSNCSENWIAV